MKKFIYSLMLLVSTAMLSSCDNEFLGPKDEAGGTTMEAMAGEWYVWADGIDADGNVIDGFEDFYEGRFMMQTFNTAENVPNKMFIMEEELTTYVIGGKAYSGLQIEVDVDLTNQTFQATDAENLFMGDQITVKNGKITYGTGKQNNGSAADEISFEIYYDGTEYYTAAYGHAGYRIHGVRYSGLAEND